VNHAIKRGDRALSACTVRLKMLWPVPRRPLFDCTDTGQKAGGAAASSLFMPVGTD
jgi:hypothetical protein